MAHDKLGPREAKLREQREARARRAELAAQEVKRTDRGYSGTKNAATKKKKPVVKRKVGKR